MHNDKKKSHAKQRGEAGVAWQISHRRSVVTDAPLKNTGEKRSRGPRPSLLLDSIMDHSLVRAVRTSSKSSRGEPCCPNRGTSQGTTSPPTVPHCPVVQLWSKHTALFKVERTPRIQNLALRGPASTPYEQSKKWLGPQRTWHCIGCVVQ
jgi:hypothetical protein